MLCLSGLGGEMDIYHTTWLPKTRQAAETWEEFSETPGWSKMVSFGCLIIVCTKNQFYSRFYPGYSALETTSTTITKTVQFGSWEYKTDRATFYAVGWILSLNLASADYQV